MKMLMFSLDESLLKDPAQFHGDTFVRFQKFAERFERFDVVVPTSDSATGEVISGTLHIYPCAGKGRRKYLALYRKALALARAQKYDLYVTNDAVLGVMALRLKKKFGGKVNINVFGSEFYLEQWVTRRPVNRVLALVSDYAVKRADLIRTDTQAAADLLRVKGGIERERISVIPVSPSEESIVRFKEGKRDEKLRERYFGMDYKGTCVSAENFSKSNFDKIILTVANFEECKDIPNLLSAAALVVKKYPNVKFVIVGDGGLKAEIEKMISNLKLENHIVLAGRVPYSSLAEIFASADLYALSSANEGLPRVLMEAGFAGVPVVSTDINGARDLIEDGVSGIIVPVKNSEALAEGIMGFLGNEDSARRAAELFHKRVMDYCDFEKNYEKMMQMWVLV